MPLNNVASNTSDRSFSFQELREQTSRYMREHDIRSNGGTAMLAKSILLLTLWVTSYIQFLTYGTTTVWGALPSLSLLAAATLFLQLGVMHDASHYSITRRRWPNTLLRLTLTFMGGSSILWFQKHVVMHHGHTNVSGSDPDVETMGLIRFQDQDSWRSWHRWQHLYAIPLYSLMALSWVWLMDFLVLASKERPVRGRRLAVLLLELVVSRISHVLLFLVIPYLYVGNVWAVAIGYVLFWLAFGLTMSMVFLMAHITDVQEFMEVGEPLKEDWALHQLATTANFSVKNRFLTWAIGGLNFQIEHHIFPNISHLHYRQIHEIVKAYCAERGVTYHEHSTIWCAVRAHFTHLKRLSRCPELE